MEVEDITFRNVKKTSYVKYMDWSRLMLKCFFGETVLTNLVKKAILSK